MNRIHYVIPIIVLLLFSATMLSACEADSTPDNPRPHEQLPPPSETKGVQGEFTLAPLSPNDPRPTIPCEGDLCYDIHAPGMKENYNSLVPKLMNMDHADIFDGSPSSATIYDTLQSASDEYASCNYYRGAANIIVVDCPEWVDGYGCPNNFFVPATDSTLHFVRVLSDDPQRHYCVESKAIENRDAFFCKNGEANTGALTSNWMDPESNVPRCIKSSECLKIAENENILDNDVCFYGDFSKAATGSIPEQDCDTLIPGTCAINCSCDNNDFADSADVNCHFLSEQNPIGLCGYNTCHDAELATGCWIPGTACAIGSWPSWAEEAKANGPMKHAEPGTCVQKTACEDWVTDHPDILGCGTPLPDNPFE